MGAVASCCLRIAKGLQSYQKDAAVRRKHSETLAVAKHSYHSSTFYRAIFAGKHTGPRFSDAQLAKCVQAFNRLTDGERNTVCLAEFLAVKETMPSNEKQVLFSIFDHNRNGELQVGEFVNGLCFFVNGTQAMKLSFLFNSFDKSHAGFMNRSEIERLVTDVNQKISECSRAFFFFFLAFDFLFFVFDHCVEIFRFDHCVKTVEERRVLVDEICAIGFALRNPDILKCSEYDTGDNNNNNDSNNPRSGLSEGGGSRPSARLTIGSYGKALTSHSIRSATSTLTQRSTHAGTTCSSTSLPIGPVLGSMQTQESSDSSAHAHHNHTRSEEDLVQHAKHIIRRQKARRVVAPIAPIPLSPVSVSMSIPATAAAAANAVMPLSSSGRLLDRQQHHHHTNGTSFPGSHSHRDSKRREHGSMKTSGRRHSLTFLQSFLGRKRDADKDGISFDQLVYYMASDEQTNALLAAVENCSRKLLYSGINKPVHESAATAVIQL
jgi:Ca2+-binding EF-hand superfamily protein